MSWLHLRAIGGSSRTNVVSVVQLAIHRPNRHPQISNRDFRRRSAGGTVVACSPYWPIWPCQAGVPAAPPHAARSARVAGRRSSVPGRTDRSRPRPACLRWPWPRRTPDRHVPACWPSRSGVGATSLGRSGPPWRPRSPSWVTGRCGSSPSPPRSPRPAAAADSTSSEWPGTRRRSWAGGVTPCGSPRSWRWPGIVRTPPSSRLRSAARRRWASSSSAGGTRDWPTRIAWWSSMTWSRPATRSRPPRRHCVLSVSLWPERPRSRAHNGGTNGLHRAIEGYDPWRPARRGREVCGGSRDTRVSR
jgi:hypothetical protein